MTRLRASVEINLDTAEVEVRSYPPNSAAEFRTTPYLVLSFDATDGKVGDLTFFLSPEKAEEVVQKLSAAIVAAKGGIYTETSD